MKATSLTVGAENTWNAEDAALADREYPAQECAPPVFAAAPPPPATPMAARSLENLMDNLGESFTTRLLRLIDERG